MFFFQLNFYITTKLKFLQTIIFPPRKFAFLTSSLYKNKQNYFITLIRNLFQTLAIILLFLNKTHFFYAYQQISEIKPFQSQLNKLKLQQIQRTFFQVTKIFQQQYLNGFLLSLLFFNMFSENHQQSHLSCNIFKKKSFSNPTEKRNYILQGFNSHTSIPYLPSQQIHHKKQTKN
eukprot:TRINITY_DN10599_c0_g1_i1.p2 TRINITY_DN10599_c0_g1~~TRINITY_DN10599_c0_g1_i1.p2  ORF type:complete len:187 (+),score=-18.90 TRINITY_DN10599_c0_g1_i1:38-562(+)